MELAEINRVNKDFWRKQNRKTELFLSNSMLCDHAFATLRFEMMRGVPVYSQLPLEACLAEADNLRTTFSRAQAVKGGRSGKSDNLTRHIESIVRRRPEISCDELLHTLRDHAPVFPIESVNDEEVVVKRDEGGIAIKSVPLSGLKDRLSRAKKKLRSR